MEIAPVLYETHSHTPLCKHANGEPEEYAAAAERRGLKGIIVTCHNPVINGWATRYRMSVGEFPYYVSMVERARKEWAGRVDVRLGLESDFVPGAETWLTELHQKAEFHYILGSVHSVLPDYRERYYRGDIEDYYRTHFEHLAQAAETGLFDSLAHPDLIKIWKPEQWKPELIIDDICRSLDRIAKTGAAMELNTSGRRKPLAEFHPDRIILGEICRRDIPVVVGGDAHKPEHVAAHFEEALELLKEIGFSHVNIFLNRKRQEIDIDAARRSLKPAG